MPDALVGAFAVLYEDTERRIDRALTDLAVLRRSYGRGEEDRSYLNFVFALELMLQTLRSRLAALRETFDKATADGSASETASSLYGNVRVAAEAMVDRLEGQVQLLKLPRSE